MGFIKRFFLSAGIGIVSGVITFFMSVAFLCFVLLVYRFTSHTAPDMSLTYKAAAPVAVLAAITGFVVALVRGLRSRIA